jgi:hypothetical protein
MFVEDDDPDTATDSVDKAGGTPGTGTPEGATDSLVSPPPALSELLLASPAVTESD